MYRLWEPVIGPLLELLRPQVVVEIGSDQGFNTRNLIDFCHRTGSKLHVIDPLPKYDVDEWAAPHPDSVFFHLAPSLEVLDSIEDADVVLIDGDHNWYTVINELRSLLAKAEDDLSRFPVVFLHDVGWPYGRRDLYYDPTRIPPSYRHAHRAAGMRPGRGDLVARGGLNDHLENAEQEGGSRNGVLTAVEDFIEEATIDLEFGILPGIHGLGILFPAVLRREAPAAAELIDQLTRDSRLRSVLESVEGLRVESQIRAGEARAQLTHAKAEVSRLQTVERDRDDERARADELRKELRAANQALTLLGQDLVETRRELSEETKSRERIRHEYDRLRSRRSVRLALSMARPFRPAFRWWRALRKGRRVVSGRPRSASQPTSPSEPDKQPVSPITALDASLELRDHLLEEPGTITVIVPIFNAYDALDRCLRALSRNTSYPAELLLIDDASTDERISPLLQEFSTENSNVRVLKNESNLGFVATVNRGFEESRGDVVILNSDVEVVPGWLRRLASVARQNPDAATVTPLSNNAGAFSAPVMGEFNEIPPGLTRDEVGRMIAQESPRTMPEAPTGNGFCMLIRRQALSDVGPFDIEAFPRGYGEENDFCMKASRVGWRHVIDDSTYVLHERSASFGSEKTVLSEEGRRVLDERYPDYTSLVRSFVRSPTLESAREEIGAAFDSVGFDSRRYPRALMAIHRSGGGTPASSLDLMRALSPRYEAFQLVSDTKTLVVEGLEDGELGALQRWKLSSQIQPTDITRTDYRGVTARVLRDLDIDVVHIRHLIGHTFDLPKVAQTMGIPAVLSLHDFYYVCPTVHLLDEKRRFCGGTCTPGQGECLLPTAWLLDSVPHLKHSWVYQWQDSVREMFRHVDSFVVASPSTAEVYTSVYPEIEGRLQVIEHGRDLPAASETAPAVPSSHAPVRILVPGNLAIHKGSELIRSIRALDVDERLEFHFIGRRNPDHDDLGTQHGEYERDAFFQLVDQIRPSLVGLFSITAETFSHTLTEAWHAGLPVVATDRGAFRDRILRDGGGLLIDPDDPSHAYEQIRRLIDDEDAFEELAASVPTTASRPASEMAHEYDTLYKTLMHRARPFRGRTSIHAPIRVGLFVPGRNGHHPGSTHVRIFRRYFHPSVEHALSPVVLDPRHFLERPVDLDVAIVQRTALSPEVTHDVVKKLQERDVSLVLDLDDDLIDMSSDHPDFDVFLDLKEALRFVAQEADLITTSTTVLKEKLSGTNDRVALVPNQLDGHLWLAGRVGEMSHNGNNGNLRLLYFGTPTHGNDLRIMQEIVQDADWVSLTVVGGAPSGSIDWCNQVEPPSRSRRYPDFVHWLRSVAGSFDAVVVPLADTPFNSAKSDLKYIESAALGLPVICSDVEAYSSVVHEDTGLRVGPDVSHWLDALMSLKEDPSRRESIGRSGFEYVAQSRLLEHHADDLIDLLESLSS